MVSITPLHTYPGHPAWIVVNNVRLERCNVGLPMTIKHGRSGIDSQPDAPTLEFTWLGSVAPAKVGDAIYVTELVEYTPAVYDSATVDYDDSGALYDDDGTGEWYPKRFVGYVAAVTANEDQGVVVSWNVQGIGNLARFGFVPVNITRPQETDLARASAIASAAGITVFRTRGTSTLMMSAETLSDDGLSLLRKLCESSGGLLWQTPDGYITYGTANHRQGLTPIGVLPCEAIADDLVWASSQDQIINHVDMKWTNGGPLTIKDNDSIAQKWGLRYAEVTTTLASQADAATLGSLIVARRAWPYWGTPDALVYGHKTVPEDIRLMAWLDTSSAVLVPFLMAPGPVPSPLAPATVEGWVETWDQDHTWQFSLTDTKRWVGIRMRTYQEVKDQMANYTVVLNQGTYLDLATTPG